MVEPNQFVSVREAAKMLGVTKQTIYRWIARGYVNKIVLPSGAIRIVRVSIEHLLTGAK